MQSFLTNEEMVADEYKRMFEEEHSYIPAERTIHKNVPPTADRLKNFKTKKFEQYDAAVAEIKARESVLI